MRITMKAGLSGPSISLASGETKDFEDEKEAQRLIDAGLAELAPADDGAAIVETAADRVARLKVELRAAETALKAETSAAKAAAAKPAGTQG